MQSIAIVGLQSENNDASANQIKKEIYSPNNNATFFDIAQEYLDELENAKNLNRLSTDKARNGFILKYSKSKQLSFQEINKSFLNRLEIYLKTHSSLS